MIKTSFNKISYWVVLAAFISLIFFLIFLSFSDKSVNKKIIESDQTMLLTDTMRHSFKVSLLTDRALISYQLSIINKDQAKLVRAIEYLEAALGFLNMNYIDNRSLKVIIEPIIKEMIHIIETQGFDIHHQQLLKLHASLREVQKNVEAYEKNVWMNFQQNYVEFQTNEVKLKLLYQYLFFLVVIFVIIASFLIIRQKRAFKQIMVKDRELEQLAFFDSITGVMSRKAIELEIEKLIARANRNKTHFAIVMFDLDDFKRINDVFGHTTGDDLLKQLTSRLMEHIREMDYFGRVGGDEFIIIFEDISQERLKAVLRRILQSLKTPFTLHSSEHFVQASFGAVEFPTHATNKSDLLKYADIAMYSAKEHGKNRFELFNEDMKQRIHENAYQEKSIRKALENREFEIHLQPQINASTNRLTGVEILSRWRHPQQGMIPPYEFIPFIENGIQIVEFHEWLLSEVSILQKSWKDSELLSDTIISVNLAIKYLSRPNFANDIRNLIHEFGIDLNKIKFEITEYSLMESSEKTKNEIKELVEEGFRFCLDDFGTGYSSITFLNDFPIEMIKIDKQFIDELEEECSRDQKLVNTIMTIGQDLNIKVLAEGVETENQSRYLVEKGCNLQQGYLFSRPLPIKEFEAWYSNFKLK